VRRLKTAVGLALVLLVGCATITPNEKRMAVMVSLIVVVAAAEVEAQQHHQNDRVLHPERTPGRPILP
jgi:hypothetical protein